MILRYCGGKSKKSVSKKILSYFPKDYQEVRFPFVGGGGVFWDIPLDKKRWINDLDVNLMSVYKALQERPEAFISLCRSIPIADEKEALTSTKEGGKPIHNARLKNKFDELLSDPNSDPALKYFFVNRTVWAGRVNYNLPSRLYFSNAAGWNIISSNKLEKAAKIIKDAKITSIDYSSLLSEDGKDVMIYLDPPYACNSYFSKESQLYAHNFTVEDHVILFNQLCNCRHKFVLSYDDDKLIRDLYSAKFNIYEEEWIYTGSSSAEGQSKQKKIGKELIITNFSRKSPAKEITLFE